MIKLSTTMQGAQGTFKDIVTKDCFPMAYSFRRRQLHLGSIVFRINENHLDFTYTKNSH